MVILSVIMFEFTLVKWKRLIKIVSFVANCSALDVTLPGLSRLYNITYDTSPIVDSGDFPLGTNVTFYCNDDDQPFTATCNGNEIGLWHVNRIIDEGCLGTEIK